MVSPQRKEAAFSWKNLVEVRLGAAMSNLSRAPEVTRCARTSPDWAWLTLAYLRLRRPSYPCEFRTRSGDVVVLEDLHDLITAWVIYCRGEYTVLPDDAVIVDAGANIGAFTAFAARRAPRAKIVSIEPFPTTRAKLERTIARNGLGTRVVVRDWALARSDSSRVMDDGAGPSQSRGMLPRGAGRGVPVNAVSLASLLEREGLSTVDLLKMDIEGGEHEVIAGAPPEVLRRIHRIALEYHPNGPKSELFGRLTGAGFETQRDLPVAPNSGVAEFLRVGAP
jgi:FkbM family methyltransferase